MVRLKATNHVTDVNLSNSPNAPEPTLKHTSNKEIFNALYYRHIQGFNRRKLFGDGNRHPYLYIDNDKEN